MIRYKLLIQGDIMITTISVSQEFKKELENMKKNNEKLEDVLKRKIVGYDKQLSKFEEPYCFSVECYNETEDVFKKIKVSWTELFSSDVGTIWSFDYDNSKGYDEKANIIYKDGNECIVKFTTNQYKYKKVVKSSDEFVVFKFL